MPHQGAAGMAANTLLHLAGKRLPAVSMEPVVSEKAPAPSREKEQVVA